MPTTQLGNPSLPCLMIRRFINSWDARNEALFAYTAYRALGSIMHFAQSPDRYPIVLSRAPFAWERLLPAFGFRWGRSIWDDYCAADDEAYLAQAYPWVIQNRPGDFQFEDERGFSCYSCVIGGFATS